MQFLSVDFQIKLLHWWSIWCIVVGVGGILSHKMGGKDGFSYRDV